MEVNFKRPFIQFVKKAHKPLQLAIEDNVESIVANPYIGEQKSGDLGEIWVYKFRFNRREYLIAYRPPVRELYEQAKTVDPLIVDFYQVGTHENFYDVLKRYL